MVCFSLPALPYTDPKSTVLAYRGYKSLLWKNIHLWWPKIANIIPAIAHCWGRDTGNGTSIVLPNPRECSSPVTSHHVSQKSQMNTVNQTKCTLLLHCSESTNLKCNNKELVLEQIEDYIQKPGGYHKSKVGCQHHVYSRCRVLSSWEPACRRQR